MPGSSRLSTAGLVDFHCHLDLYPDHQTVVQESDDAGVFTLAVTTTPRAWPRNHELAQRTRHVRVALDCIRSWSQIALTSLICGINICQRHAMSVKWAWMRDRASTSHLICRSKSFSMFCSVVRKRGTRSSQSTVSGRLKSCSITLSPICRQHEAKWCSTGLLARRRRQRARWSWDVTSRSMPRCSTIRDTWLWSPLSR